MVPTGTWISSPLQRLFSAWNYEAQNDITRKLLFNMKMFSIIYFQKEF